MIDIPILNRAYYISKLIYFHPDQKFNIFFYLNRTVYIASLVVVALVAAINFFDEELTPQGLTQIFNILLAVFQAVQTIFVCAMYKSELRCNYKELALFWKIEETNIEEKYKTSIRRNIDKNTIIPKLFLYGVPFGIVLYTYNIFNYLYLNLPPFIPQKYHFKFITNIIKAIVVIFEFNNVAFVFSFDIILICTCICLEAEFEVLAYQIKSVINSSSGNKRKKLIICIEYHDFLLKFAERTKNVLKLYCLSFFLIALLSAGTQMFVLAFAEDLESIAVAVFCCAMLLTQYGMYCFPMSRVTDKSMIICDLIYDSNWEIESKAIKELLAFVLLRTQKAVSFSIGGMMEVSRENYTDVFKACMSIFSFAKAMKEKGQQ